MLYITYPINVIDLLSENYTVANKEWDQWEIKVNANNSVQ